MYRIVNNGLIAIPASLYLTPNTQNTRGHGCKFRVPAGCVDAFNYSFLHTVLLFGFGTNCRLLSLCRPPSSTRPSNLDWWASRRLRRQRHSSCFYLTLLHVFYLSVELGFIVCSWSSCTSAMHDITQLWGMCIIGKEEEVELRSYATVLRLSSSSVCPSLCTECIAAKRCILEQKLLLTAYRKKVV